PASALLARVDLWGVSPKLSNAGRHRGHQDAALHRWWRSPRPNTFLKFVCRDVADAEESVAFAMRTRWPRHTVWLMPEGDRADLLRDRWPVVADAALKAGVNATQRLHVLAWDGQNGRPPSATTRHPAR